MKKAKWIVTIIGLFIILVVALVNYEPGMNPHRQKLLRTYLPGGVIQVSTWASKDGSATVPIDGVLPQPFTFGARTSDKNAGFFALYDGGDGEGGKTVFIHPEVVWPTNYLAPSAKGVSTVSFAVDPLAYTNEIRIICTFTPVSVPKKVR